MFGSIVRYPGQPAAGADADHPPLRLRSGSTEEVRFLTRKVVMDPPPTKSHLNHVVLDGVRGNSWEEGLARAPRARPARQVLRQERAARLHDPLRPRGPHPRVRARLPRPPRDRAGGRRAHADRRGLRQPQVARADRGQGRHRPQPVVRGRQQLGRVRPLGLRRGPQPAPKRRPCSTKPSTTCTPTARSSGCRPDRERTSMPPRKTKTSRTDAGRRDHARRQAGQPPDRRRPGLRHARARAADPGPLPARPDARPAARLEGQGRARRRGPRRRRARRSTSRRRSTRGSSSRTSAAPPTGPRTSPS